METKELVIHLIREELRCKSLTHSLEELGFDCIPYTINISPVILDLMSFNHVSDELSEKYCTLIENALSETNFWNLEAMLAKWSKNIYSELLRIKSAD